MSLDRIRGGRRRILQAMFACGAAGPSFLAFPEALAAAPPDPVAELNILIQGDPVGDALKAVANPMFAAQYSKVGIELNTSTNAAAFPKMLAQRSHGASLRCRQAGVRTGTAAYSEGRRTGPDAKSLSALARRQATAASVLDLIRDVICERICGAPEHGHFVPAVC